MPLFAYGNLITALINFILLAFVIFLLIKQLNRFRRPADGAAAAAPSASETYLKEIRDLFAARQ